jgi:hypothetical protein
MLPDLSSTPTLFPGATISTSVPLSEKLESVPFWLELLLFDPTTIICVA